MLARRLCTVACYALVSLAKTTFSYTWGERDLSGVRGNARFLQGGGVEDCEPICLTGDAKPGDHCLCGYCVETENCVEEDCVNNCSRPHLSTATPPLSVVLEPIAYDDEKIEVEFVRGCTEEVQKTDGYFSIQKKVCTKGNNKLNPEIVILIDGGSCKLGIHTSCSQPFYIGQIFSVTCTGKTFAFKLVGYCIQLGKNQPICEGKKDKQNPGVCPSPQPANPTTSPSTKSPSAIPQTASPITKSPTASPTTKSPTASFSTKSPTASPATSSPTACPTVRPTNNDTCILNPTDPFDNCPSD